MSYQQLYELAFDRGFQERVRIATFDVARDKAPIAVDPADIAFINGILNGENDIINVVLGVVVVNNDPQNAVDSSLKSTVEAIWPFYAKAWVARVI